MSVWTYQGRPVIVPRTADIPPLYRHKMSDLVQRTLSGLEPWEEGDWPIETLTGLRTPLVEIVVPVNGRRVFWGKHAGHHAKQVRPSPFVRVPRSFTTCFTVEMTGTSNEPVLVRAYPGDYIPPLPWQRSAVRAEGKLKACIKYWREHAYVYHQSLVLPGTETDVPPDWSTW